jgi:predicted ATP-dependent endonuclease of OLD family
MHLHRLRISNFRAIEDIEVEFDSLVSVIIGPNAIGKTTILEAIRVSKSVLAPRTQNETAQTLNSLGVTSPHMPQRLFSAALTTNPNLPTSVKCAFRVEVALKTAIARLIGSTNLIQRNPHKSVGGGILRWYRTSGRTIELANKYKGLC